MEDYTNEALECSRKYWSTKLNAIKSQSSTLILNMWKSWNTRLKCGKTPKASQ